MIRRAIAVLGAAALVLAGCSQPASRVAPAPGVSPSASPFAGRLSGGAVAAPAKGIMLGAWVKPAALTQTGRVAAVRQYEKAIGRPLEIVNTYRRLDEAIDTTSDRQFARKAVLMLSWATGDTRSITLGHSDPVLRERAQEIKAIGRPVLLRVRWEMDRPGLAATIWSAEDYIAAYRHIRTLFAGLGVTNVAWVWCPTAEGFAAGRAAAYYPGDDVVDWVCVDAYAGSQYATLPALLQPFLAWAAARPKPIVLGEFGISRAWGTRRRVDWFTEAGTFVHAYAQIKAVSYFESDPDGNGENQQFRVADDPEVLAAFRAAFTRP
ncbi:glycosyl hydrolase [Hamadaea tsunoensis]|uniref:glycosyl hydrolase n=1 Tax=Hamadaea tsunoensis TaxID=53368 RepID=UPI0004184F6D|nr:glycosyl hydrolase [Hamadaea tsunoensis]